MKEDAMNRDGGGSADPGQGATGEAEATTGEPETEISQGIGALGGGGPLRRAILASRPAGARRRPPVPDPGSPAGRGAAERAQGNHAWDVVSLARTIDHTLLKPEATTDDVLRVCREARDAICASACVNARFVPLAAAELEGCLTAVCAVVGFPLGAMPTQAKAFEASWAVLHGAREIDMVLPIGALKAGEEHAVWADIRMVRDAIGSEPLLKVILETGLLTDAEKVLAAQIAVSAGADFVKTSTGFGHGGATVEDIRLLRQAVGSEVGVKASGGIGSYAEALRMLAAGADRLGMSGTLTVLAEARQQSTGGS